VARVPRAAPLLALLALLLAGCAQPTAPREIPTGGTPEASTLPASATPVGQLSPPSSPPRGGDGTALASLGVALAPYDAATGRAGDVVFDPALDLPVLEFGGSPDATLELRVAPGATIAAPAAGTLSAAWRLGDGTPALNVTLADGRIVVLLRVAPTAAPGPVAAGAAIARPSEEGGSWERYGIALLDPSGSTATCAVAAAPREVGDAIARLEADWRAYKNDSSLYPASEHGLPGCRFGQTPWRPDGAGPAGEDPYARTQATLAALPPCGAAPFNASPMALGDVHGIVPLGNINPPEHTLPSDHVYLLYPRLPAGSATGFATVDVFAPGDITIYTVQEQLASRDGAINDDFAVDFAPCREVTSWFGHVSSLAGGLKEAFDAATRADPGSCTDYGDAERNATFHVCNAVLEYRAKAGEKIGAGGGKASAALDMGAHDSRAPPLQGAVSPARYPGEESIVCPLSLFSDPPRAALEAKLGQDGAPRTTEPRCGTPFQDVAGTLAGAWFRPEVAAADSLGPNGWNRTLENGVEPWDGTTGVLALGGPGDALRLSFAPRHAGSVDRAFAEVTPGDAVWCYQSDEPSLQASSVLLRLADATRLDLARLAGPCGPGPWTLGADALEYVR